LRIKTFQTLGILLINVFLFAATPVNIALWDFEEFGISLLDSRALSNRLRTLIIEYPQYQLLERNKMDEILKEQGFQQSGCVSDACIVEAGQLLGVQQMLFGSFGHIGSTYTVDMRIIDVKTGKVFSTSKNDLSGPIDNVLKNGLKTSLDKLFNMESSINVNTIPPGADISVGNISKGVTPIKLYNLLTGSPFEISIYKEGYRELVKTLQLRRGENLSVTYPLERLKGKLTVNGIPPKATVEIGSIATEHTPVNEFPLETGEYPIIINKPGYKEFYRNTLITADNLTTLDYKLEQLSLGKALLYSGLFPGMGQIYQGDKIKGLIFAAAGLVTELFVVGSQIMYVNNKNDWIEKREAYNQNLTQPEKWPQQLKELNESFDRLKTVEDIRNGSLGAFGLIWTINIIEVAL